MSFLFYLGCKGSCHWDWHSKTWYGRIIGVRPWLGSYTSPTEEDMQQAFEAAVDGYLGPVQEQPCVA